MPTGWGPLYLKLITKLARADPEAKVVQAKQKLGELRVYLDRSSDRTARLTRAATRASRSICEMCGAEGRLHRSDTGYIATLCPTHRGPVFPTQNPGFKISLVVDDRTQGEDGAS